MSCAWSWAVGYGWWKCSGDTSHALRMLTACAGSSRRLRPCARPKRSRRGKDATRCGHGRRTRARALSAFQAVDSSQASGSSTALSMMCRSLAAMSSKASVPYASRASRIAAARNRHRPRTITYGQQLRARMRGQNLVRSSEARIAAIRGEPVWVRSRCFCPSHRGRRREVRRRAQGSSKMAVNMRLDTSVARRPREREPRHATPPLPEGNRSTQAQHDHGGSAREPDRRGHARGGGARGACPADPSPVSRFMPSRVLARRSATSTARSGATRFRRIFSAFRARAPRGRGGVVVTRRPSQGAGSSSSASPRR